MSVQLSLTLAKPWHGSRHDIRLSTQLGESLQQTSMLLQTTFIPTDVDREWQDRPKERNKSVSARQTYIHYTINTDMPLHTIDTSDNVT
jgi:hypothetical protein